MQITLINCRTKLQVQGIDLITGNGVDTLCMRLQEIVPCQSWGYSFQNDSLTIEASDGTAIPDMSAYGEVVVE